MAEDEVIEDLEPVSDSEAMVKTMTDLELERESGTEATEDDQAKIAHLGDDDLSKHVKFKADGEELDMPMEKIIALAQKGVLHDKKSQELADGQRKVDDQLEALKTAQQAPPAPEAGQTLADQVQAQHAALEKMIKDSDNDPNVIAMAKLTWQGIEANALMQAEVHELKQFRGNTETNTEQERLISQGTDQVETVMAKFGLTEDEGIELYKSAQEEGRQGNLMGFFLEQNVGDLGGLAKKLNGEAEEEAEAELQTRKSASVKPTGAPKPQPDGGKKKVPNINSQEWLTAVTGTLTEREYQP